MANILAHKADLSLACAQRNPVTAMIDALLRTRREVMRISLRARRERLQQGYGRVPQRVWDRRSALLIDR